MKGAEVSTDRALCRVGLAAPTETSTSRDDTPMTRLRSTGLAPLSLPPGAVTPHVVYSRSRPDQSCANLAEVATGACITVEGFDRHHIAKRLVKADVV
jgi:hypothetical protein